VKIKRVGQNAVIYAIGNAGLRVSSSLMILIAERPLTGYEYGVGGKIFEEPRFYKEGMQLWSGNARVSLHQDYLSICVEVGIFAFAVWCLSWGVVIWRSVGLLPEKHRAYVLSTLSMCLVLNMAETAITGGSDISSIFFWTAWVIGGRLPYIHFLESDAFIFDAPAVYKAEYI
jgi:hypothetical protein